MVGDNVRGWVCFYCGFRNAQGVTVLEVGCCGENVKHICYML